MPVAKERTQEPNVDAPQAPSAGESVPYARRPAAPAPLRIYKPGQGVYVRWGTAVGAGLIAAAFARFLYEQLALARNDWVRMLVPVVALVLLLYGILRLVGQNRKMVDFLLATEGEMKKVNWSSRREVFGATRVVIVTVLLLGLLLFVVDVLFMFFFESIHVLRIGMLSRMFGGGAE